eukprot:TRINITY_DN2929_c0_g1_i2.p1 TRINITY_DN2929_c0_g1~~TRINITY_DN2929_c0_g1_i2.p1  ORF type:complete len:781 (+),score=162.25 TRINITY_DN2929_c0_g1_i2:71-2413(+)
MPGELKKRKIEGSIERGDEDPVRFHLRAQDWSSHLLGSIESWPTVFATELHMALTSYTPTVLFLGAEKVALFNSEMAKMMGEDIDLCLQKRWGRKLEDSFPELSGAFSDCFNEILRESKGQSLRELSIEWKGKGKDVGIERYFDIDIDVIMQGVHLVGFKSRLTECTNRVLEERRLRLGSIVLEEAETKEIGWKLCEKLLADSSMDVLCFAIYQLEGDNLQLFSHNLKEEDDNALPISLNLEVCEQEAERDEWKEFLRYSFTSRMIEILEGKTTLKKYGYWKDTVTSWAAIPFESGLILCGLSRRRMLDDSFKSYLQALQRKMNLVLSSCDKPSRVEKMKKEASIKLIERMAEEISSPLSRMKSSILGYLQQNPSEDMQAVRESILNLHIMWKSGINQLDLKGEDSKNSQNIFGTKESFLAYLAHEIRTPLAPAFMLCEELRKESFMISSTSLGHFEKISAALRTLMFIVENLLDMVKISKNKLFISEEEVDLEDLLKNVINYLSSDEIKLMNLDLKADKKIVLGDPTRLSQVIWNILRNAIQFGNREKNITITLRNVEKDQIELEVVDHGIGIETERLLSSIFEAKNFEKEEKDYRNTGLGIGLFITKTLIEAHGGTLIMHSDGINQGTRVTVQLPTIGSSNASSSNASANSVSNLIDKKILLVEDNDSIQFVIHRILVKANYSVEVAGSVAEAIQKGRNPFDLILCDIGLPDGDGFQLLDKLKRECQWKFKSIALSGYSMKEDLDKALSAGFDTYLIKPVAPQLLLSTISNIFATTAQ